MRVNKGGGGLSCLQEQQKRSSSRQRGKRILDMFMLEWYMAVGEALAGAG
jgi:hypothetical protein